MSTEAKSTQITWHGGAVTRADRQQVLKQQGCTIWFTGLSGSGKSTLAVALERELIQLNHAAYVLDGDNVRFGLNASPKSLIDGRGYSDEAARRFGLSFAAMDRVENVRRIGEVTRLFADAGLIALTSFISPYRQDRDVVRRTHQNAPGGPIPFLEVYVNTPIEVCESRDPKGLYKQAREAVASGRGLGFTGIDDPYEPPLDPELSLDTAQLTTQKAVANLLELLKNRGIIA